MGKEDNLIQDGLMEESATERDTFYTIEEAAQRMNVSSKTISRWRKQGLRSETRLIASRNRVVIRQAWLDEFTAEHSTRVEKGRKFSQMSPSEREEIVERARRMAAVGATLTEVIHRLVQNTGRSAETIRYTLKNHDTIHPEAPIFARYQRTLDEHDKRRLLEEYRRGTNIDRIAQMFERTKTSVYRIIADVRAAKIRAMDLEYISCAEIETIEEGSAEELLILGEIPEGEARTRKTRVPSGLPSYLASLYSVPLLTFEQEQHLFRKMNYLKLRAAKLRNLAQSERLTSRLMDRIENDFSASNDVKNQLVSANLRLVVSIAKRHTSPANNLFDLISDGNMSLIRAVEKFDYSRRNRFSTYGSWAIMKNYARAISEEQSYYHRFMSMENESNFEIEQEERDQAEIDAAQLRKEKQVAHVLKHLSPREQQIIIRRFGLNRDREPLTLKQVGLEMGVTKERIRQIEILALSKLRQMVEDNTLQLLQLGPK